MNSSKILLSAAALALLAASPAFATSGMTSSPSPATAPEMDHPPADTTSATPDMSTTTPETPSTTSTIESAPSPADSATTSPAPSADIAPAPDTATMPATEDTTPAATATPEETSTPATAPAEEPAKPAPVKKKATPPAKLSALAKKYDLMSLDTDGNKSLSKAEFTANGFASDKTFARFDADHNGKLTNAEINAYAATIEAGSKK